MAEPPKFDDTTKPRHAIDAALEWLAGEVGEVELVRSRQTVRRSRGATSLEAHFSGSTWSRGGIGVWMHFSVTIADRALGRWRRAHPDRASRTDQWAHVLATYGNWPGGSTTVHLSDEARAWEDAQPSRLGKARELADLPDLLRDEVLPLLDSWTDPLTALTAVSDSALYRSVVGVAEWAISRDDEAQARQVVATALGRLPVLREYVEADLSPEGPPPPQPGSVLPEVTRRLRRLGLIAPGEPLPV